MRDKQLLTLERIQPDNQLYYRESRRSSSSGGRKAGSELLWHGEVSAVMTMCYNANKRLPVDASCPSRAVVESPNPIQSNGNAISQLIPPYLGL